MARHPAVFAEKGLTTKTLESASRARQAFFESGWRGASALIKSDGMRYERSALFDAVIRRGVQISTSFMPDILSAQEQQQLGELVHCFVEWCVVMSTRMLTRREQA